MGYRARPSAPSVANGRPWSVALWTHVNDQGWGPGEGCAFKSYPQAILPVAPPTNLAPNTLAFPPPSPPTNDNRDPHRPLNIDGATVPPQGACVPRALSLRPTLAAHPPWRPQQGRDNILPFIDDDPLETARNHRRHQDLPRRPQPRPRRPQARRSRCLYRPSQNFRSRLPCIPPLSPLTIE
jgi:hypothetical protein